MRPHISDSRTLRDLIRTYQVSFSIQSSDVVLCGRTAQITFHLDLSGHHDGNCAGAFCLGCNHVLRVLFEVADVLRDFESKAVKRAGYVYENSALCGSRRERKREVVLGLRLTVRRPFARATGGWGWKFVDGVTSALTGLGCRDGAAEGASECGACVSGVREETDQQPAVCHGRPSSGGSTREDANGVLTYGQFHARQQGISGPMAPVRVAVAKSVG